MTLNSSDNNIKLIYFLLICSFVLVQFSGCYSFKGGIVPEHLKSVYIEPVTDESGLGNPQYSQLLNELLIEKFRNDNTFQVGETDGDARIRVTISSIRDEITTVSPGELATEKRLTLVCTAEYYDAIKKVTIFKRDFQNVRNYALSDALSARDAAIREILNNNAEDIVFEVVSGW